MGLQPVTHNGPFTFREAGRRKRCFATREKERERQYSTIKTRFEAGNTRVENDGALLNRYYSGTKRFKPTCKESIKFVSSSGSILTSRNAKVNQRQLKRPYDRFACDTTTWGKVDAPVVKKRTVDKNKHSSFHHVCLEGNQYDKQKTSSNEVKWMYRNQHANMCGPYATKQLMEGLQACFLPEDLLIFQVDQGKLSKPVKLKQLIDDSQGCEESICSVEKQSGYSSQHSPVVSNLVSCHSQPYELDTSIFYMNTMKRANANDSHSQQLTMPHSQYHCLTHRVPLMPEEMPRKAIEDVDLPPGFGGSSPQQANCAYTWNSSASLAGFVGAVNPSFPTCETADMIPPGFEAAAAAGALPGLHTTGSFPHSKLSFSTQGVKVLSGNYTGLSTWGHASLNAQGLEYDVQAFAPPHVCIGLPVCKPAVEHRPLAFNLLNAVKTEIASSEASQTMIMGCSSNKQSVKLRCLLAFKECTESLDPVELVHQKLFTAVKRSYATSVLSLHISEHLEYWLASEKVVEKLSQVGKGCPLRQDHCVDGMTCSGIEAKISMLQTDCYFDHRETFLQHTADQVADASFVKSSSGQLEEQVSCLSGASIFINSSAGVGSSSPIDVKDNEMEANKFFSYCRETDDMLNGLEKSESCIINEETSKSCSKSSSPSNNCIDDCKQVLPEEMPYSLADGVVHAAALTEPTFLKPYKKRGNAKSLNQLMSITLKVQPELTKPSVVIKEEKRNLSREEGLEASDWMKQEVLPNFKDGCARTSLDVCEWHKGMQHYYSIERSESTGGGILPNRLGSMLGIQSSTQTARTNRAHMRNLAAAAHCTDILKLAQSKVQKKKLKFARSKIHGWGLYAIEPIEAGDFVIEYIGVLVRPLVADIRERLYEEMGIGSGYLFRIDNETVVDATKCGGFARFINHSCDPNCFTKILTAEGSKKLFIYAKRRIRVGEELTYDYKFLHKKQEIPCHCASTRCRGDLNC